MRANTNITLKDRMSIELSDFKGVDFSSSPLRVSQNRSPDAKNFINEYGVNKKRHGWKELFRFRDENREPLRINGIYKYIRGSYNCFIIHAGTKFFKVVFDYTSQRYISTDITLSSTYEESKVVANKLKDQRSQFFLNKERLYIIGCGDFLVYGTWDNGLTYELRRVANDKDTYVPTTTISIDDDSVEDNARAALDDINMLCSYRINQLVGSSSTNKTWTLDSGEIDNNSDVEITIETMESNNPITIEVKNNGANKTILYNTSTNTQVGTINFATGQITLSIATTPQITNRDNIFVKFSHSVDGYLDRIANCNFGVLFGVNGNSDRLFVSGNSEFANIDFHSESDDFTYFGDLNTSSMGSSSVAVAGYGRLSDSTLVIYKEDNAQEANIFYRNGTLQETYDSNGNLESIRAVFPTTAGSIGEGVISRYATANFAGDNLILSRNGVYGIVLPNNITASERYTRERSRTINEKLTRYSSLKEAVGIVWANKYLLAIEGDCFVADARFKFTSESDLDGSYNYEWWFWDNIPARVWANIENELYFGGADGQVCVFDEQYIDREYEETQSGDLLISVADNKVTYNKTYLDDLADNDTIKFNSDGIYALELGVQDLLSVADNRIKVSEDKISELYVGTELYADYVAASGLSVNKKYIISDVDAGACTFALEDENGNAVSVNDIGFRLSRNLKNIELYLCNTTKTDFELKYYKDSNPIRLVAYNNISPTNPLASLVTNRNVVAVWTTPILDFGTNSQSKTLLQLTIATEPTVNGEITFGYDTKDVSKAIQAKGVAVFDFDNINFENFSFDTGFASSYTKKVKQRNFNFIIFRFESDNEYNCAVNTFSVLYKINKMNKGVR